MSVNVSRQAVPMPSYEDVGAAADWLSRVFGFVERDRFADDRGRVTQAELELQGATVMLGWPGPTYVGPKRHAETCDLERAKAESPYVVDGALVCVPDVEAHLTRARAEGATILGDVEDTPFGRFYRAEDIEGHRWMFLQPA